MVELEESTWMYRLIKFVNVKIKEILCIVKDFSSINILINQIQEWKNDSRPWKGYGWYRCRWYPHNCSSSVSRFINSLFISNKEMKLNTTLDLSTRSSPFYRKIKKTMLKDLSCLYRNYRNHRFLLYHCNF